MATNPYQAPNSNLIESPSNVIYATRLRRFFAFTIDFIVYFLSSLPFYILKIVVFDAKNVFNLTTSILSIAWSIMMFALLNGYLIKTYGQTIGKWLCNIYIAENGRVVPASFSKIFLKRYLPILIIVGINYIGLILLLVDLLSIFKDDKRCFHDLIADTQVLNK